MTSSKSNIVTGSDTSNEENLWSRRSLKKPKVPCGLDPDTKIINEMIVDKSWKIITGSKLHEVYTQEAMEEFINAACRNDFALLQNKFKITSIDAAINITMVPIKYRLLTHNQYR
jgi:hypothetical protein